MNLLNKIRTFGLSKNSIQLSDGLYFNHIPRTAGTSLRSWINSFFNETQRCPALHPKDFLDLPPKKRNCYMFYAGHLQNFPWQLLPQDIMTMTVLREPSLHFSSLVAYYAKERICRQGSTDHEITNESKKVIKSLLYSPQASQWPAINMQTKWLSGLDPFDRFEVSPEILADANAAYQRCFLVGIVERMQETVDLLAWHRGWPHENFIVVCNTTPSQNILSEEDRDKLDTILKHDNELYKNANRRLDEELIRVFGVGHSAEQRAALISEKATSSNRLKAGNSLWV